MKNVGWCKPSTIAEGSDVNYNDVKIKTNEFLKLCFFFFFRLKYGDFLFTFFNITTF